jgi:hypothetical protein
MGDVKNKSTKGGGGSAKTTAAQLAKEVNKAVNNSKLSATETKFINNLINKAAATGKGISVAEKTVIINEARKQTADKNSGVAKNKTSNIYNFLESEKKKLPGISLDQQGGPGPTGGGGSEPIFELPPPPPQMVRVPERDVVSLAQESISAETITNLLFENVGANELTKFVRHDTVEGINPYYDVISNLSDIKRKFDPSNLISLQKTNSSFFDIYPIKLQDKIPSDEYLLENNLTDYLYIDTNGDLVIEVVNLKDSEIVEIEIDTSGTIFEVDEL